MKRVELAYGLSCQVRPLKQAMKMSSRHKQTFFWTESEGPSSGRPPRLPPKLPPATLGLCALYVAPSGAHPCPQGAPSAVARHSDPQGQRSGGHQSEMRSLRRGDSAAGVGGGPARMRQGCRGAPGVPRTLGAGQTPRKDWRCGLLARGPDPALPQELGAAVPLPAERSTHSRPGRTHGPSWGQPASLSGPRAPRPSFRGSDRGEQRRIPGRSSSRTTNLPLWSRAGPWALVLSGSPPLGLHPRVRAHSAASRSQAVSLSDSSRE